MERRILVFLSAVAVAVVAVGLSAAATMSRGGSPEPAKKPQAAKPAKKALAKAPQREANEPVTSGSGRSQSAKEIESYWTKERMEDAQPMEKTRQSGSPSSSPAPSGTTAAGSMPTTKSTSQKARTKNSQSTRDTGAVTGPALPPSPGYWTKERMDDAQPMERTRPGGSGAQGSPNPGGPSAPGSPPP